MFCIASIWKMYSLPERRAGSPVHISLGPRMAKSRPARCISLAIASETFWFLSSNDPAQPTQYRYSWSKASPGSTISMPGDLLGPVAPVGVGHAPGVRLVLHAR